MNDKIERSKTLSDSMPWMTWMKKHAGEVQMTGAKPTEFTIEIFKHTTYPPLTDYTPECCAATVCAALEENGYSSTRSAAAASYIGYGLACDLKEGCIIVFQWPDGGHHVDFCDKILSDDQVQGLGGNQGHALQDSSYPRKHIVATRWPVRPEKSSKTSASLMGKAGDVRLGKRHARHDPRVRMLARYLPQAPLPAPPDYVDWFSKISDWGMMQNDTLGDCTCAAVGHVILQWSTYASQQKRLTDADIVTLYEQVGGYNPNEPSTDQGAVEVDVLNYWLNNGVVGDRLEGYASIEVGNIMGIKDAISWFGNVYIGLQLPLTAKTQEYWIVPPGGAIGEGAPGSWGGHAVPVVGYDARWLYCITWGQLKRLSYGFWSAYCDEAYALLSRDFMTPNHLTPGGMNWDLLVEDMALLRNGYDNSRAIRHI